MCFSASASFIAGGGLVALGGASLHVAKKEHKVLAVVPLLFGVQQIIEGVQWLYLNNGSSSLVMGYSFLFFAFIVWPIYTPTFIYILDKKRRSILKWFIFLGIAVALYLSGILLMNDLIIHKLESCINYGFKFPLQNLTSICYMLSTFGPFFLSSKKFLNWFGVVFALFAIIALIFYTVNFISVWCFFAAIVSFMFFLYVRSKRLIKKS